MPNVMAALPNIGGALCSTQQSLADTQYWNAVQLRRQQKISGRNALLWGPLIFSLAVDL